MLKKAKIIAMMTGTMLAAGAALPAVAASAATHSGKSKPTIEKILYDDNGVIELDFKQNVELKKGAKVTVKDSSGKSYSATITKDDSDELDLKVKNYKVGKTYSVTINGIRNKGDSAYSTLTSKFSIPKRTVKAKSDKISGKEVTVNFNTEVDYLKNAKVTVKGSDKKTYKVASIKKGEKSMKFSISNLKPGISYSYAISGVVQEGATSGGTIKGSVTAPKAKTKVVKPTVEKVEYEGSGKVEVDFKGDVDYKNLKVTAKDSKNKSHSTKILKKDDDSVLFQINGYKAGETYSFSVSGVSRDRANQFTTVSSKVKVPAAKKVVKPTIEKVEYEGSGKVEVDFKGDVDYKNLKVTAKDSKNKSHSVKVLQKDDDSIRFQINGYKAGETYSFSISGVSRERANQFTTVSSKVKVPAAAKRLTATQARDKALQRAGLKANQVHRLHTEFDSDDNRYSVEFRYGNRDYEVEVHATSGAILSYDVEYDD